MMLPPELRPAALGIILRDPASEVRPAPPRWRFYPLTKPVRPVIDCPQERELEDAEADR